MLSIDVVKGRSHRWSEYLNQTRSCGREMIPLGLQRSTLVGSGRGFNMDFFDMSTKIRVVLEKPGGLEVVWNRSCSALVNSCILVYKI